MEANFTKKTARAKGNKMMAQGKQMISSAEFRFGISKEISREQFATETAQGNAMILDGLDLVDLTYASNWKEFATQYAA